MVGVEYACASQVLKVLESVRDSKANGAAERSVRSWASQLKTIRHHVERRLKTSIPKDSATMTWLVSWVADSISRYKVHSIGRTGTSGSQGTDATSQSLDLQRK